MIPEPAGLGERGSRLFRELSRGVEDLLIGEMIVEAARAADRLDDLDRAVQGQGVQDLMRAVCDDNVMVPRDTAEVTINVELTFDRVLLEARQQQSNFRQLLSDIAKLKKPSQAAKPATQQHGVPQAGSAADDELARRRAMREKQQHG